MLDRDLDRHHIFPRAQFDERRRSKSDIVANIAFIKGESNKSVGAPSPDVYLKKLPARVLESQCIPARKELWDVDNADEFWARRREALAGAFNAFLADCFPERNLIA